MSTVGGDGGEQDGRKGAGAPERARKIKSAKACDQCRRRKGRCDLTPGSDECRQCTNGRKVCTWNYQQKKPGPPPKKSKHVANPGSSTGLESLPDLTSPVPPLPLAPSFDAADLFALHASPPRDIESLLRFAEGSEHEISQLCEWTIATLASREGTLPTGQDGFADFGQESRDLFNSYAATDPSQQISFFDSPTWSGSSMDGVPDFTSMTAAAAHEPRLAPVSETAPLSQYSVPSTSMTHRTSASFDLSKKRKNKITSLDAVAPRHVLLDVISLYLKHLYPLMPLVHKPSFSQHLWDRREESDPAFLAFLFSLSAYTLVQMPKSMSASARRHHDILHKRCHLASAKAFHKSFSSPTLLQIATLYCDHIYLGSVGKTNEANVTLAEAIRLAFTLRLHDEHAYLAAHSQTSDRPPDAVEIEIRRRLYWVLFGSDKTIAVIEEAPIQMRDDSACVSYPLQIDDELITPQGHFPSDPNRTPLLTGFTHASMLHSLLGRVTTAHRADAYSGSAMTPQQARERFMLASSFQDALRHFEDTLPAPLHPDYSGQHDQREGTTGSSTMAGTMATAANGSSQWSTMAANLVATRALVSLAIRSYKSFLIKAMHAEAPAEADAESQKQWVAATDSLMSMLQKLNLRALLLNGHSMVYRLMFVTSALSDNLHRSSASFNHVMFLITLLRSLAADREPKNAESSPQGSDEDDDENMLVPASTRTSYAELAGDPRSASSAPSSSVATGLGLEHPWTFNASPNAVAHVPLHHEGPPS